MSNVETPFVDPDCFAQYMGYWLIEDLWFRQAVAAVKSGQWLPRDMRRAVYDAPDMHAAARREKRDEEPPYRITKDGIAVIGINGPMMKGDSKYGGTSTIRTRYAVRSAARDDKVKAILLSIDSPGGTVAGTGELAHDVMKARLAKPVHAHIEDLGASAAYWVASQAENVTASDTAEIGSIGTVAIVEDTSKMAEMQGITVHVISSGEYKGSLTPGVEISKKQLAYVQERVDAINERFLAAVEQGRGIPRASLAQIADGKVYIADQARRLGLINTVQSMDNAIDYLSLLIAEPQRRTGRLDRAARNVRLAKAKHDS